MRRSIKQIMRETEDGSIVSKEAAKKLINYFVEMHFRDLNIYADINENDTVDALLDENQISQKALPNVTYIQFVAMLDQSHIEDDGSRMNGMERQPYYYAVLNLLCSQLRMAARKDYKLQLFMNLSVHTFFQYLESLHHNKAVLACENELAQLIKIDRKVSIATILQQAQDMQQKRVFPFSDFTQLCQETLKAYKIISILLIDSFRNAYPERFHIEDIGN